MHKSKLYLLIILLSYSRIILAQWQITQGPGMLAPRCIASIDSVIFVATYGGLYKSIDGGVNWEAKKTGAITNSYSCIYSLNSILYLGTNGSMVTSDDGLFKSTDYGNTWTKCKDGKMFQIQSVGNKLFVLATGGTYSSVDNGVTWKDETVTSGLSMQGLASNSNKIFGYIHNVGIYSREAADTSWSTLNVSGITDMDFESLASKDSTICVATTADFFISSNMGISWIHPLNTGIITSVISPLLIDSSFIFAGTTGGLIRTSNNGVSWDTLITGAVACLIKFNNKLLLGTQNGLFSSSDFGSSWVNLYSIYSLNPIKCLANKDSVILAGLSNSIYYSADDGDNWNKTSVNNGNISCLMSMDTIIFSGTSSGGGVYKKNWNDTIWSSINNGLSNLNITVLANSGNTIYAGTNNGLFCSTNQGQNWTDISSSLPYKNIYALLIDGSNIYAGTVNGVYISQNNGVSWSLSGSGIPAGAKVQTLAIKDSIIFAGTFGYGIFISNDQGTNWIASNSGIPATNIFVKFISITGSNVFACLTSQTNLTIGTLYLSIDNGASWSANVPNINNITYSNINAIGYNGNNIFAASNSNFLLKKPLAQLPNSCATISSSQSYFCENDSFLLSANAQTGYTYQWLKHGIPISGATSSIYYAKQVDYYSCVFGGGCLGTSPQILIHKKPVPQPTISTNYFAICPQNDSSLIQIDSVIPSYSYQWYRWDTLISGATQSSYYAKKYGSYVCIAEDSFLCHGISNPQYIGLDPYADTSISAANSTAICHGDSVLLQVNNGLGNMHQWRRNGVNIAGATNADYYAKLEGSYNCLITFHCTTLTNSISVSYTPTANFIAHSDTLIPNVWHIQNLSIGKTNMTYLWDWGDFTSSTGDSAAHLYTVASNYAICLTATDSGGCTGTYCDTIFASAIYIIPPLSDNLNQSLNKGWSNEIKVFPVPFSNQLDILLTDTKPVNLKIYNILGKLIYQNKFSSKLTIPSQAFAEGMYLLEFSDDEKLLYKKISKEY